jgi:hypothetical protein
MSPRTNLLRIAAVALAIAGGACRTAAPADLNPNAMRELFVPAVGQTEAAVVKLNGAPDHREQVDGLEMWVYARTLPAVPELRSRSAIVWFRDGVVVKVGTSGGFSAPNPTFPAPQPAHLASGRAS